MRATRLKAIAELSRLQQDINICVALLNRLGLIHALTMDVNNLFKVTDWAQAMTRLLVMISQEEGDLTPENEDPQMSEDLLQGVGFLYETDDPT